LRATSGGCRGSGQRDRLLEKRPQSLVDMTIRVGRHGWHNLGGDYELCFIRNFATLLSSFLLLGRRRGQSLEAVFELCQGGHVRHRLWCDVGLARRGRNVLY